MTQLLTPQMLTPPVAHLLARHAKSNATLVAQPGDALARSYIRLSDEDRLLMQDRTDPVGQFMPRVMQQMQTALVDVELSEIPDFIDTNLPGWRDAGATLAQQA